MPARSHADRQPGDQDRQAVQAGRAGPGPVRNGGQEGLTRRNPQTRAEASHAHAWPSGRLGANGPRRDDEAPFRTSSDLPMDDFDLLSPPASRTVLSSHQLTIITSADDVADSPAARLLRDVLHDAAERHASDIHIEPDANGWRIRLRIDGVLHQTARPAPSLRDSFVTRIKVLSRIDIAERRIPQDGRLRI